MNNQEQISFERLRRAELRSRLFESTSDLEHIICRLNGNEKGEINWNDLKNFPSNKWFEIDKGIESIKIEDTSIKMVFDTKMKAGASFASHIHEDCKEIAEVIEGLYYDAILKTKVNKGEQIIYEKATLHKPVALNKSRIIFTFLKQ